MTESKVDVVIIGGGIVGCATAYYLAKRKLRVAVVERAAVAAEQSSRAWGFVRQQGRHRVEVPLAAESSRIMASPASSRPISNSCAAAYWCRRKRLRTRVASKGVQRSPLNTA
jgi:2-polyprenyl-6-methoxyphenol hydroxylase-like FAD-dependent oxidoreductase